MSYRCRTKLSHRTPDAVIEYCTNALPRGIEVIIAAAGGAAHLAGVVAAKTSLPVLGVPMESQALKGDGLASLDGANARRDSSGHAGDRQTRRD